MATSQQRFQTPTIHTLHPSTLEDLNAYSTLQPPTIENLTALNALQPPTIGDLNAGLMMPMSITANGVQEESLQSLPKIRDLNVFSNNQLLDTVDLNTLFPLGRFWRFQVNKKYILTSFQPYF